MASATLLSAGVAVTMAPCGEARVAIGAALVAADLTFCLCSLIAVAMAGRLDLLLELAAALAPPVRAAASIARAELGALLLSKEAAPRVKDICTHHRFDAL